MHCGKRFIKCIRILFEHESYTAWPQPSAYILQKRGGRRTIRLAVCLANLKKVWSTLKLDELPSLALVANWNIINLTNGIDAHISQVVLKPLEEFFARSGRPLSAYFESQHRFYEPHYAPTSSISLSTTFPKNCF